MLQKNQQIGDYKLIKQIRPGDISEIWLAENGATLVQMVIRQRHLEPLDLSAIQQKYIAWAQASTHKNILSVVEVNIYDGRLVIVSEYPEGGSLAEKLRSQDKFPLDQAIKITIEILDGLDHLHSQGIIHQHLNPYNIFLQNETSLLADFEINSTDGLRYLAPEVVQAEGVQTIQTDLWSAGVILYRLLSGKFPFPSQDELLGIIAILTVEFSPLPDEIPVWLKEIVRWALTKKTESRYKSAEAMRRDLKQFLDALQNPSSERIPAFTPSDYPKFMYPGASVVYSMRAHSRQGGSVTEVAVAFDPVETVIGFYEEKFGKGQTVLNDSKTEWKWEDNIASLKGYKMISVYPESSISLFAEQYRIVIPANAKAVVCFSSSHW